MKCISIRQPWAYMILHCGKDIENRNWATKVRGRVLIHAAKGMTKDEWVEAWGVATTEELVRYEQIPDMDLILRGGIVGSVEIVDCVARSDSPWFFGEWGFVLRDPLPLPFRPLRGQLGFFDVDEVELYGPNACKRYPGLRR